MKSILQELARVEKHKAYQILHQVMNLCTEVQIKIAGEKKITNSILKKIGERKHFYIVNAAGLSKDKPEITIKIIINGKLFFLKTEVKKFQDNFYFESYERMFELVRRKNIRFQIPQLWPQTASIQAIESAIIQTKKIQYSEMPSAIRSVAAISEMSKSGMMLNIVAEIPRYEKNQIINLRFKLFRRAEIQLKAKIIHSKKNNSTGPTVGVQFMDESILIKNKIQNVCDDLAFYHAAQIER